MKIILSLFFPFIFLLLLSCSQDDIIITEFEGSNYDNWKVEGEAFDSLPYHVEKAINREIKDGFSGGFVNSNVKGKQKEGRLVSPEFNIQKKYLNFLITGSAHYNAEDCNLRLLVDGNVAKYAAATRFPLVEWTNFDMSEYIGMKGHIEILDRSKNDFIMVDQILQSDDMKVGLAKFSFKAQKQYLLFPVSMGEDQYRLRFEKERDKAEQFVIEMGKGKPDFWAFQDISRYKGERLTVLSHSPQKPPGVEKIRQSDTIPGDNNFYHEKYRPQFHFTPRQGWMNDPNGLVYYDGEWHLMYQHNPYGKIGSLKHWGHAVSEDLFHWKHLPHLVVPGDLGSCHSGGAVVDHFNSTGLQNGDEHTLLAFWTSAGHFTSPVSRFTQSISYSNDRGRTWHKYKDNPIIGQGRNRDPNVRWHEEAECWVMALFLGDNHYAFFRSDNLIDWEMTEKIKMPANECPDLFQLPLDGNDENLKWVFWGGNGKYVVGEFDGKHFTIEGEAHQTHYGNRYYAAQTFNNSPGGRIIQMGWLTPGGSTSSPYKNSNYKSQLSVPNELTLRTIPEGNPVLYSNPVKELKSLRKNEHKIGNIRISEEPYVSEFHSELSDIRLQVDMKEANEFIAEVRGVPVVYNKKQNHLIIENQTVPLETENDVITLRILVDRASIEIFCNEGRRAVFVTKLMNPSEKNYTFKAKEGIAEINELIMYSLSSAWH